MRRTLAERLTELREAAGLTQVELARRAGVSKSLISRLERGDRTGMHHDTALKIARALGVDVSAFDVDGPAAGRLRAANAVEEPFPEEPWRMADPAELLRAYVESDWWEVDQPTHEEMRFLSRMPIPYKRDPPDADAMHAILLAYRERTRRR